MSNLAVIHVVVAFTVLLSWLLPSMLPVAVFLPPSPMAPSADSPARSRMPGGSMASAVTGKLMSTLQALASSAFQVTVPSKLVARTP